MNWGEGIKIKSKITIKSPARKQKRRASFHTHPALEHSTAYDNSDVP